MSIGYWLALPATLLLVAGALRGARLALRDPDPGRRAAFGLSRRRPGASGSPISI